MGHMIGDMAAHLAVAATEPAGIAHYSGIAAHGLLRHAATVLPNRTAIRYGHQKWTYEQLNYDAVRCAAMFQSLGIRPGDCVGILLPNVPEFIIAANGVWRAGGIVVALSPLMVEREVREMIKATACRFVVCLDMLSHMIGAGEVNSLPRSHFSDTIDSISGNAKDSSHAEELPSTVEKTLLVSIREHLPAIQQVGYLWMRRQKTGMWSLPSGKRIAWFWEEVDKTHREWLPVPIDPVHDAAYILPTGGTTANPKAVTLSHQNLVANAWQQYVWTNRLFGTETMLAVLPFFHSYGLSATVLGGAAMGATLILHHRFNTRQVIRLIEEERPTVFHAVPAMLTAMNERLTSNPADLKSLRWVISGGAPLEPEVAMEFAGHSGALVVEGYGLSEASPVTHVGPLYQPPRYGTIGMPLPETEVRIIDPRCDEMSTDDTRWVASDDLMVDENDIQACDFSSGTVGELVVRGPQVMLGYWRDAQSTSEAIRDGWLHTGDLATVDADGFYRIVGRKKDLIITSGYNVYPTEVEEVLCNVPGVAGAAVVGVLDHACGEVVKAIVQMRPGAVWDETALRSACNLHLAKHKRPRIYRRCEGELPRNFLGKLIRRHLRDSFALPSGRDGTIRDSVKDDVGIGASEIASDTPKQPSFEPTATKGEYHE